LPVRQTQSGTLMEFSADALEHGFDIGQARHVAHWIGAGSRTPARGCTRAIRLRPYPVLSPMPAYAARRPVPGLLAICASSTPGLNGLRMRGFSEPEPLRVFARQTKGPADRAFEDWDGLAG
jgi:hypothetical protein